MKIVFMGTPEFAAKILSELLKAHEVVCVCTQQDKPRDRGKKIQKSHVKLIAEDFDIPVFQPERIKSPDSVNFLKNLNADMFIVAAYGQILSREILDLPAQGCINVHASLLPKLRGAAPIQWAIANGDEKTGITIMKMDEGLDTGDMLYKAELPIGINDTGGTLTESLAVLGAKTLLYYLENFSSLKGEKQKNEESTYAPLLKKEIGEINWNEAAKKILDKIRAFDPVPSSFTTFEESVIKIWKAEDVSEEFQNIAARCGEILAIIKNHGFVVKTGANGAVLITEVQGQGKKRMSAPDFLRGFSLNQGDSFL